MLSLYYEKIIKLMEIALQLQALPGREELEHHLADKNPGRSHWAARQLERLRRGFELESNARILIQSITLGNGLTLVALEGEPVSELGLQICNRIPGAAIFPLGYSNGMGLYLPTSRMLDEGGYEAESYYEYGYAAPLAKGIEAALDKALAQCVIER